jgi:hypothetical protein
MKSIRELIDILESIENSVDEARKWIKPKTPRIPSEIRKSSMNPGDITISKIDPKTGEKTTSSEKPESWVKQSYYKYLVPLHDIDQAKAMGLRRIGVGPFRKDDSGKRLPLGNTYWYMSIKNPEERHKEAEEVFGPGEWEEKNLYKGTRDNKVDLSPTIKPNTLKYKDATVYRNNLPGGDASGKIDPSQQFKNFSKK